jgi:hypothetical protein
MDVDDFSASRASYPKEFLEDYALQQARKARGLLPMDELPVIATPEQYFVKATTVLREKITAKESPRHELEEQRLEEKTEKQSSEAKKEKEKRSLEERKTNEDIPEAEPDKEKEETMQDLLERLSLAYPTSNLVPKEKAATPIALRPKKVPRSLRAASASMSPRSSPAAAGSSSPSPATIPGTPTPRGSGST